MGEVLTISRGQYEIGVAARAGGSLAAFRHGGVDLMRPIDAAGLAARDPRAGACFPMVPFCGRLAHGRFDGHQVALNFAPSPHAIHGNGWQRPWTIADRAADRALMRLDHQPDESWPFAFVAEQAIAITDQVTMTLTVVNRDRRPMPAGVGFHPYFVRTPGVTLTARVRGMWEADRDLLPTREVPTPFDFDRLAMDATRVDSCFTDWDGHAVIDWPELGRRMTIGGEPGHLVVFSPQSPRVLCVEPQSMMPDAFNRGGGAVLAPGQSLAVAMRLAVAVRS